MDWNTVGGNHIKTSMNAHPKSALSELRRSEVVTLGAETLRNIMLRSQRMQMVTSSPMNVDFVLLL
jgi:hypothetical protein